MTRRFAIALLSAAGLLAGPGLWAADIDTQALLAAIDDQRSFAN